MAVIENDTLLAVVADDAIEAALHRDELRNNWATAQAGQLVQPIEPLV